jgi:uncharacterized protein YndB with AHSA1/START domain
MNQTIPTSVDRANHTIVFERLLSASPESVFEAWTEPDQLALWWDPSGEELRACEVDLRVGGAFRFENAGHSPPFVGTYRVVERPTRLVFDAIGAIGTVTLEPQGSSTRMHVSIRCASAEHLEQFLKLGVDVNTERTFDNLAKHVLRKAG